MPNICDARVCVGVALRGDFDFVMKVFVGAICMGIALIMMTISTHESIRVERL